MAYRPNPSPHRTAPDDGNDPREGTKVGIDLLGAGRREDRVFRNPWPAAIVGLAAAGASSVWLWLFGSQALPLLLAGLLAAGASVAIRPQSPLVLFLAACSAFLFFRGSTWDSARMFLVVLTSVALLATVLMLLPRVARRAVVSVLVLLHFGGIVCAVFLVPPTPWLAELAAAYFYRPYHEFMYLQNAYHFYSPEPGPGLMIWFYARFEDGTLQEYKMPNRAESPLALEYQRRLSLCESLNQQIPVGPIPDLIRERRRQAGLAYGIYGHPEMLDSLQYRPPNAYSRRMLSAYAHHVALVVKHPTNPEMKAQSVRIYRVVHRILMPKEIQEGERPDADWLSMPYYEGEYDVNGKLLDADDPFLYWLIPILRKPGPVLKTGGPFRPWVPGSGTETELVANFFERHLQLPLHRNDPVWPAGVNQGVDLPPALRQALQDLVK
jgi:hypothetical protein